MGEHGAEDKPKRRRWSRHNLQWEGEFEYFDHTGSAKRWQHRTPAMAAGLTDHVWSVREVLRFRVPPWPQPAGV
jgi:hypothetical protein